VNVEAPGLIQKVPLRTHSETQHSPTLRLLRTSKTVDFDLHARDVDRSAAKVRKQRFCSAIPWVQPHISRMGRWPTLSKVSEAKL
jgi:hypothetical protein